MNRKLLKARGAHAASIFLLQPERACSDRRVVLGFLIFILVIVSLVFLNFLPDISVFSSKSTGGPAECWDYDADRNCSWPRLLASRLQARPPALTSPAEAPPSLPPRGEVCACAEPLLGDRCLTGGQMNE